MSNDLIKHPLSMKTKKKSLLQSVIKSIRKILTGIRKIFTPDPLGWKSASFGIIIITFILLLILAGLYISRLGIIISGLFLLYFSIIGIASAFGFLLIFRFLKIIPDFYKWVIAGAIPIFLFFWPVAPLGKLVIISITVLSVSFIAGTAGILLKKGWKRKRSRNTVLNLIFLTIGLTGLILGSIWVLSQGRKTEMPENAALKSAYRPSHIDLPDPSGEGEFEVVKLCYGSGKDKHREEFGKNANIITEPVDGKPFVSNWDKFNGWARTKYWGFNEKALPLNARVWYPGGKGPFPLVLIVHGNHLDREYSDPGYEYLGRLMASRGFIFVSVDENFLNASWSNMFRSLKEESDCRAWLLLKHLELWKKWNNDSVSPFYRKADLENIALIGHSRGGEAVAIAAAFNQLPFYPDDATVKFNFGYNIKSVIAIAPVDGQYKPARTSTFFSNVNYFVLQGSHDMDMQSYHGARQYQRIKFTDGNFHVKAGLYIWGANHGQFNTVWGRNDVGYPGIAMYNRKQLIPEEDQMKIAKVYVSAFLEATLNQKPGYLALFRDWRSGIEWLPETIYLNQYEDSDCKFVCTFEEDIDLETTTLKNRGISSSNLTVWKENLIPLKWGEQDTRAVITGWNLKETDSITGSYNISIEPGNELTTDSTEFLILSIAQSRESSNPNPKEKSDKNVSRDSINKLMKNSKSSDNKDLKKDTASKIDKKKSKNRKGDENINKEKKDSLDFTVILEDFNNIRVQLPLSHYSYIQPQLEAKIMKADFLTKTAKSEIVFQTFFLPLSDFRENNTAFDPTSIKEISFLFDKTDEGVLVIDNIGFWGEVNHHSLLK
jgi:hypothetical protein